jgi:uncharacterized protein (DUF488 family)
MGDPEKSGLIYTIGHSNHTLEHFLKLLQTYQIEVLVDIRSHPYSGYSPQFNAFALQATVIEAGIRYLFLGKELGGQPSGEQFYDADGHVLYSRVADSPFFQSAISKLEDEVLQSRMALMCSEENPAECHRRLLVGRVLAERGIEVAHIRGEGRVQTEEELHREEAADRQGHLQLSLFDTSEVMEWKSTQSVLEKRPPRHSSER